MKDVVKFHPAFDADLITLRNKNIPVNQEHINARRFIIVRTGLVLHVLKWFRRLFYG